MSFADDPHSSLQRSRCNTCGKTSSQVATLRKCARCRTANYCTRECLIADFSQHRTTCWKPWGPSTQLDLLAMTDSKGWLSSLPDFICVEAVIDAYRLRIEDEFLLPRKVEAGTLYAGDFPLQHFNRFLQLAVERGGLPDSWTPMRTVDCIEIALDERSEACILHAVDHGDILEKWDGNLVFVNALRMIADRAYGRVVEYSAFRFTETPVEMGFIARWLLWLLGRGRG